MSDFNKVIIMGRLTAKPELRYTPGGDAVATLNVASGRRYKTKSGDEKEETLFIDVIVWRKTAETCAEYLIKGQKVMIEGRLMMRKWETKDNEKRKTYEIEAQRVIFLEKPRSAGASAGEERELSDLTPPPQDEEEEIPF